MSKVVKMNTQLFVSPGEEFTDIISGETYKLSHKYIYGIDFDDMLEAGKVYRVTKRGRMLCLTPIGESCVSDPDMLLVLSDTPLAENLSYLVTRGMIHRVIKNLKDQSMTHYSNFLSLCLLTKSAAVSTLSSFCEKDDSFGIKKDLVEKGITAIQGSKRARLYEKVYIQMMRNHLQEEVP